MINGLRLMIRSHFFIPGSDFWNNGGGGGGSSPGFFPISAECGIYIIRKNLTWGGRGGSGPGVFLFLRNAEFYEMRNFPFAKRQFPLWKSLH